ncbi:hypothetical protein [Gorillibacterium timonense]|uniref:hypothetical protein n=1 Tax=Gorillibacterium timonense TaxID=1689269 RepID=UPI00071DA16D|nr:hypothetical protein [Gorillibacterium timonense]
MNSLDFRFPDSRSAKLAMEMLIELGFRVKPVLHVAFERGDLTSALEIAQAYGGSLEHEEPPVRMPVSEQAAFDEAYPLNTLENVAELSVPAHIVTEDMPETYLHPPAADAADAVDSLQAQASFDPSGDDFDHVDPGVHL